MVRVFVLLAAVQLVLVVLALISCPVRRTGALRAAWRCGCWSILLVPLIGAVAYLVAGRPVTGGRRPGRQPLRPGPPAPDDDPEFLRRWTPTSPAATASCSNGGNATSGAGRPAGEDVTRAEDLRRNEDTPPTEV